jgi:integrase
MTKKLYFWHQERLGKVRVFMRGHNDQNPRETKSETCDDMEAAEAWKAEMRHTLNEGTWRDPAKRKRPLQYYADEWWEIKRAELRPSTLRNYKRWLDKHVLVRFGDDRVGDITDHDVRRWLASKAPRYSAKSRNEMLNVLDGVLTTAVEDKAIRDNPARGKRLSVEDYEGVRVTMDQIIDFIDCVAPRYPALRVRYRAAVWVLVYTGLRSGEVWGLRICDIDWATGDAKVTKTYGTQGGYDGIPFSHAEGPVKTRAGKRDVHIPDFVLEELQAEIEARGLGLDSDEPLFLNKDGKQVNRDTFQQKIIRPAAERAGLPKGFRAHDLRGSHISLLLDLGANIKAITAEVGHEKGEVTLKKYARTMPGSQAKLTTMIEESHQAALEARRQGNIVPLTGRHGRKMVESQRESPGQRRTNGRKI